MIVGISGYKGAGKDTVGYFIQDISAGIQKKEIIISCWEKGLYPSHRSLWQVKKFAGKLKEVASILTGIPVEDFEKPEVKHQVLPPEWNYWVYRGLTNTGISWDMCKRATKEEVEHWAEKEQMGFGGLIYSDQKAMQRKITVRKALQWIGTECFRDNFHPNTWVNALFADYKGENWLITDCRFPNEAKAIKDRGGIILRVNRFESADKHRSEIALDDWEFDYIIENNTDLSELFDKVEVFYNEKLKCN